MDRPETPPPVLPSFEATAQPILFFDGECGLCARSVQFVLRHERNKDLRFAPLQSEVGQRAAERAGLHATDLSSVVYMDRRGAVTTKSAAALRVAKHLRLPWRLVRVGFLVPPFLRNAAYDWVARRRHRWFGAADACALVSRDDAARMLV